MSGQQAASTVAEAWCMSVDALWDEWVLAEVACELALYLWNTAPVAERGGAYREYVCALRREARAAGLLARTRPPGNDTRRRAPAWWQRTGRSGRPA